MNSYSNEDSWREAQLARVPKHWRRRVERLHLQKLAAMDRVPPGRGLRTELEQAANSWLADTVGTMDRLRVAVNLTDSELVELAKRNAREALDLAGGGNWISRVEAQSGASVWTHLQISHAVRQRLARYVATYGIQAPGRRVDDGPAIARMTDEHWWRRGLRVAQARALEEAAIGLGYVHKDGEIYASDATVERRLQQRRRNAAALEDTQAINLDTGEYYQLAELAARSVANPRIRRGELMTRIAGFEAVAKGMGHSAEFWTATCPSRMHRKRQHNGRALDNPKYDGITPREAQSYLTRCWARFRAAAHRRGLRIYGFRIAEPHHDSTPHWHLLIFSPVWTAGGRRAVPRLRALFRRYFLADSAGEAGAKKNRCEFKAIDWERGSAAGYVAKYVSKNIDGSGYEVLGDSEGHDEAVPTPRVEAWASTWGIRQFQQIGGPPVGVWRELRRLPDNGECFGLVEVARRAADCGTRMGHDENGAAGNWRRFVEVMGGPLVERQNLPIRIAQTEEGERWSYTHSRSYPAPPTRYGEKTARAVFGVTDVLAARTFASKRYRWELKRSGAAWPTRTCVNNCTRL